MEFKGKIGLVFCKKCKLYTDPRYWIFDKNSNRPKNKCVNCGTEQLDKLVEIHVTKIEW